MNTSRAASKITDRFITFLWRLTRPLQPGFTRYGAQYPPRPIKELDKISNPPLGRSPVTISVVVPSLNQGRFLERCIKSILDQNYPRLELIVVDGGSTDGSPEILKKYSERLSWWCSEKDQGQAQAINKGFTRGHGEIMCWVNSDDLLVPGTLQRVERHFRKNPRTDVVYGHRILIDENDMEIGRWITPPHEDKILSITDVIPQETIFWRRRAWNKAGGKLDESFRFAMDWDLLVRFRDSGARMTRLPYFMGLFRIHPCQKSSPENNRIGNQESQRIRKRCLGFAPSRIGLILLTARYHLWARVIELWHKGR